MIRKLTLSVIAVLASAGVYAQTLYNDYGLQAGRNEVTIGYGLLSMNDFSDIMNNLFPSVGEMSGRPVWATGSINLGYSYQLYDDLEVGGMLGYSGNMGNMKDRGAIFKNFFSIMPQAKYEWFHSGKITLYSRLAIGLLLVSINNTSTSSIPDRTAASFTFQASPIGIEIGRSVAFFAEAGFGATGAVTIGIKKAF